MVFDTVRDMAETVLEVGYAEACRRFGVADDHADSRLTVEDLLRPSDDAD